jgi:hypothetical protein
MGEMTASGATRSSGRISANGGLAHRLQSFTRIGWEVSVAPIPAVRGTAIEVVNRPAGDIPD